MFGSLNVFVSLISHHNTCLSLSVFLWIIMASELQEVFFLLSHLPLRLTPQRRTCSRFVIFMGVIGKIHMTMFILLMIWFFSWLSRVLLFVLFTKMVYCSQKWFTVHNPPPPPPISVPSLQTHAKRKRRDAWIQWFIWCAEELPPTKTHQVYDGG